MKDEKEATLDCRLNAETIKQEYSLPGDPELLVTYSHIKDFHRPYKTPPGEPMRYYHYDPPEIYEHVIAEELDDHHVPKKVCHYSRITSHGNEPRYECKNPKRESKDVLERLKQLPPEIYEIVKRNIEER